MTQVCPKCNKPMKSLGPWPDFSDEGKIKETFVCEADCKPKEGQGFVTVRAAT